jgi:hypothetical protein
VFIPVVYTILEERTEKATAGRAARVAGSQLYPATSGD